MTKPTITKSRTLKIVLEARNRRLEYKEGCEYGNGVSISKISTRHTEKIFIEPTEGGPEDWIEGFIAELRELKTAIIESRSTV